MIEAKLDGHVHGQYNFTMRCTKCKLAVFSGLSNDKENVERVIRQRFAEIHTNCNAKEFTDAIDKDESLVYNIDN